MVVPGRRRVQLAALVAPLVLLAAGCGSDSTARSSSGQASPSETPVEVTSPTSSKDAVPEDAPACKEIWRDGAEIPRFYQGCVAGGEYVERDRLSCSSGQSMIRYGDSFYGVLGGTVHEATSPLNDDRDYRAAVNRCRA